MTVEFLKTIN